MTKIVIAGSRFYENDTEASQFIEQCIQELKPPFIILSGGCRGADKIGEQYAAKHGFAVEHFLPNWALYGRGAGPKRNRDMVDACDAVICFWDGQSRGTKTLIEYAEKANKPIYIKKI